MNTAKFASQPIYKSIIATIDQICRTNDVDATHGLAHALKIATLTEKALDQQQSNNVDVVLYEQILCAALLHDVDDRKFFKSVDCQNARLALKIAGVNQARVNKIITMIELVSFAKNGNTISSDYPIAYYIPRYVDRSEAIGIQGLYRSHAYNQARGFTEIFNQQTPRPQSEKQLYECSKGRDIEYMNTGFSKSVVDHFFDKLVHIKLPEAIENKYLIQLYEIKHKQMVQFILKHSRTDYHNYINDLEEEYREHGKEWENI